MSCPSRSIREDEFVAARVGLRRPEASTSTTSAGRARGSRAAQFTDPRPEAMASRALRDLADGSPQVRAAADLQQLANRHSAATRGPSGGAVQRKAGASAGEGRTLPSAGPARALRPDLRATMEASFGMDFSSVRVHEGARAPAMGALAYTQGSQIHFAPGSYQPDSQSGRELLGHEMAHVVQQARGRVQATGAVNGVPLNDDPGLEREADVLGRHAVRGFGSAGTLALPAGGSGETSTPSASSSPASQSMPVQRVLIPRHDPNLATNHPGVSPAQAEGLYDDALRYLWTSPTARFIYDFIHGHALPVEVLVGSVQSFTSDNGASWMVEWNPFETAVLVDTDTRTMALNQGIAPVQQQNISGTLSTAVLLLHELGHVKQHMETRNFEEDLANQDPQLHASLNQSLQTPASNMTTWLGRVHPIINGILAPPRPDLIPSTVMPPGNALAGQAHWDVVEPDNVTRHERPVEGEKLERRRMNYFSTLNPGDLPVNLRAQTDPPVNAGLNWRVNHSLALGGRAARLVSTTIITHLTRLVSILRRGIHSGVIPAGRVNRAKVMIRYLVAAGAYFTTAFRDQRNNANANNVPNAVPTFRNP